MPAGVYLSSDGVAAVGGSNVDDVAVVFVTGGDGGGLQVRQEKIVCRSGPRGRVQLSNCCIDVFISDLSQELSKLRRLT